MFSHYCYWGQWCCILNLAFEYVYLLLGIEFRRSVFLVRTLNIRNCKDGFEIPFHNFQYAFVLDLTISAWIEANISCRTTPLNIKLF